MPITTLQGTSRMYYPFDMRILRPTTLQNVTFDATDESVAIGGRVWFPGRAGTKDVSRVWFRFGSVTKSGGSGLTVSLQSIDPFVSAEQPRPDGTPDETVAIANGNASFASNTWIRTGTFSADRTVSYNEKLAVVVGFDGSGRQGSDSVSISARSVGSADTIWTPWITRQLSGTWLATDYWPIIVLEFDDGSYGTLNGAYITGGVSSVAFNSGSTHNEYGLQFTVPYAVSVDQVALLMSLASAGSNFDLVLYNGTSAMMTRSIEADVSTVVGLLGVTAEDIKEFTFQSEQTLNAGSTYVMAVKPSSANNVSLFYETLADSGHRTLWGDTGIALVKRNGGSWTVESEAVVPCIGLRTSARQDELA